MDSRGRPTIVEETLAVDINAGWQNGRKVIFSKNGSQQQNVISLDLVVIIDERPHGVFMRDGDGLIITEVSLSEALIGYTVKLTTLDGRSLIIPILSIISPGFEEIIHGEGMPLTGKPGIKGNLKIRFQIKFPTKLLGEQKANIMQLLAPS